MAGLDPAIPFMGAPACHINRDRRVKPGDDGDGSSRGAALPSPGLPPLANPYATAACATVGPSPSIVVRRMSRTSLVSL
jgi:hypothetical protein